MKAYTRYVQPVDNWAIRKRRANMLLKDHSSLLPPPPLMLAKLSLILMSRPLTWQPSPPQLNQMPLALGYWSLGENKIPESLLSHLIHPISNPWTPATHLLSMENLSLWSCQMLSCPLTLTHRVGKENGSLLLPLHTTKAQSPRSP